jgi:hypothetical protein
MNAFVNAVANQEARTSNGMRARKCQRTGRPVLQHRRQPWQEHCARIHCGICPEP